MGIADLHIHTTHSPDGTATVAGVLKQAAYHANLDVIAITDHNCICGALEAMELASVYGIEVIPGMEISTADGHLLALFIGECVPAGRSLEWTVSAVGELGGLCIAPHPTFPGRSGIGGERLKQVLQDPDLSRVLVGVEAYNGGTMSAISNPSSRKLVEELQVAEIASSDSHVVWTIGQVSTWFQGSTADQLRTALEYHLTRAVVDIQASTWSLMLSWMRYRLLRSMGWVVSNRDPQAPLVLCR